MTNMTKIKQYINDLEFDKPYSYNETVRLYRITSMQLCLPGYITWIESNTFDKTKQFTIRELLMIAKNEPGYNRFKHFCEEKFGKELVDEVCQNT